MKNAFVISSFVFLVIFSLSCNKTKKNDLKTVKLKFSKEAFEQIKQKRKEALKLGILMTVKGDYVKAGFEIDSQYVKSKIRLKGDWVDHLEHPKKWSFRVKIGKGETFNGMRKISLQHPNTRNYIYEWAFHKMQEDFGLIAMRYSFVNLILDVNNKKSDLGIYALEEAFDKRLIENNENRTGIILKFDESELWENRAAVKSSGAVEKDFQTVYENAPIANFNKKSTRRDSLLTMEAEYAKVLLDKYRKREIASNEVFDLEQVGKFMALVNLFGAEHAVIWHNLRFYYNPLTALLEPIGFDAIGGNKLNYVIQSHIMDSDSIFAPYHNKYLQIVQSDSFLNAFMQKHAEEMNKNIQVLNTEYEDITFDVNILKHNQSVIRSYLERPEVKSQKLSVKSVSNIENFPFLEIDSLNKQIEFKPGNWKISKSLLIPKGYKILAKHGVNIDLINGAEIISESPFFFEGTADSPIKIYSSTKDGDGLFLKNCSQKSSFKYVDFDALSNPKEGSWFLTGAVTFYRSDVSLDQVRFTNNRSEDALNIFDASFTMQNSLFENTFSDAFDGDFVNGTISNSRFDHLGNDAIDVSGSFLTIDNIIVNNAQDKCISAGEKSIIEGEKVYLSNSELALTSKDLSEVKLSNLEIENCKVGFVAFQKKSEFDSALIEVSDAKVTNTKIIQLIDSASTLNFNGKYMPKATHVMERLYGNEFGKSSK